ncbi:hypothetical protein TorRG33x02_231860 [Trema orientale]|uniref:Uncharacterized protein n=1 Tax=Trema orientale TaxID=63057 RepID=A0A2P5E697_TREOI|nr:hypothetical protein TorRG33x02_231860 [Trema orientale]
MCYTVIYSLGCLVKPFLYGLASQPHHELRAKGILYFPYFLFIKEQNPNGRLRGSHVGNIPYLF